MKPNAPNLFILGIAKSGTTTLADSLRQHPEIFITPTKEPTFFSSDLNYAKGMDWYLDTFYPTAAPFRYRGDASPSYAYFGEKVARRIKADLGSQALKFILIFRNPVDRAYSHYWHNVNRSRQEHLTFEQALEVEPKRLSENDSQLNDLGRIRYAYFTAGLYAKQLRVFWQHFPREDFLLLLYEDLQPAEFARTIAGAEDFLDLRRVELQYAHSNASYRPRSRIFDKIIRGRSPVKDIVKLSMPILERGRLKTALLRMNAAQTRYAPMEPSTRRRLVERYKPEIRDFETILQRDLSAWLV